MTTPTQHDTRVPAAASRLATLRGNCMGAAVLAVHAIVALALLGAAISALVRSVRVRRAVAFTAAGLAAILVAAGAGVSFAGHQGNGASLTMALATAVAMFCYLAAVF